MGTKFTLLQSQGYSGEQRYLLCRMLSEVLEHIKEDAEKYRLQVAKECEELKENAFKEGYEEGYKQWAEHLADFEKQLGSRPHGNAAVDYSRCLESGQKNCRAKRSSYLKMHCGYCCF